MIAAIGKYVAEERVKLDQVLTKAVLNTISDDILRDFMGKLERDPRFHNLKGLFSWMQSYFDACSDTLKPCIFYLLVFPTEHKRIRRKRLLRRWIAEGYSSDTFGDGTAKEKGEKLFDDLVELCIIQQRQTTRSSLTTSSKINDNMYQVNGFFREYIISRPMEDNLVFALEGRHRLNSQRTGQHLTIRSCWNRNKIVFESLDFTRLRSLTVFGMWMPFFISRGINMRLLRVLDLEDTESDVKNGDLKHIGKLLPRLKFLSLRGCKGITRLPDSIGDLRQLQTLDVKHTKIVTMPRTIIKLVKLQYVRADPISDEGDDARPPAEEDDCASTSSYESCVPSDDGMVYSDCMPTGQLTTAASTYGYEYDMSTSEQPTTADGKVPSTSRGGARNNKRMALRWAGWCCTNVLFILVGLMLHTFSFGKRCWDGARAQVAAGLAQPLRTSQVATTIADGGGTIRMTEIESDVTSTNQTPAAAQDDGTNTRKSASAANGNDTRTIQKAAEVGERDAYQTTIIGSGGTGRPVSVHCDDTSLLPATSDRDVATINGDGGSTSQPEDVKQQKRGRANDFLSYSRSWLSRKKKTNDGGVKVPAGIGNLTALHTLGVVKVSGTCGKAILKEMKQLTQLRNLGVSGINQKNWQDLCTVISGLHYLESLSVRLDKEQDAQSFFSSSVGMFSELPKTLTSLKLYKGDGHGNVQVSLVLIMQLIADLNNLRKVNLELTISTQEDIYSLWKLPQKVMFRHLCVKPVEDGKLYYGRREGDGEGVDATLLKIDCGRYKLVIAFVGSTLGDIEVLVVHCSTTESSLELYGLEILRELKEVWLTGSYSETFKQHLQQKVDEVPKWRGRVLKLKLEH